MGGVAGGDHLLQVLAEFVAQIRPGEAEGDGGLKEPCLGAAIEALAPKAETIDLAAFGDFLGDGVGQLQFAALGLIWLRFCSTLGVRM